MLTAVAASPPARSHSLAAAVPPLTIALVAALFVLCHPYAGLVGDATIYALRALADLDPAGLGRDPAVVLDGQMHFSLFPSLYRPLVAAFGASRAAMMASALGSATWFVALAALAHRLAPPRVAWAMVAIVAVLPVCYGDHGFPFGIADTSATPRPFAEAAVMAGLAALLAGRWMVAVLALAVAMLVHPIMAEAGVGIAVLLLLARVPWPYRVAALATVAALGAAAFVAGLAGVPLLDRLVTRPDPAWLEVLRTRSPFLFPTLWTSDSFCPLLAQVGTIVVAAHRAAPAQRRLLLAALVVAALGLAIAAATSILPLLLVIQAQAWRAVWLLTVLGGCGLAACIATLSAGSPRGRLTLAALLLAWFFQPLPALTLASVGLAVVLDYGTLGARLRLDARHATAAFVFVAVAALWWASGPVLGYVDYLRQLPSDQTMSLLAPLHNNLHNLPLLAVIAAALLAPAPLFDRSVWVPVLAVACLLLVGLDLRLWDQRDAAQAYLESLRSPPGLAALAEGRKPGVLWLDDEVDAWFALGRPQYFSPQQGVSIVFSRALASLWVDRAGVLTTLGLEPRGVMTPWKPAADDDRMRVTQDRLDAFCARADAPGLVIVPQDGSVPALRDMVVWHLPAPLYRSHSHISSDDRRRVDGFGIVPCAPVLPRY